MILGLIGYGYWGKHYARLIHQNKNLELFCIADRDKNALKRATQEYPSINNTEDEHSIIENKDIDAIVVCTPVNTHFSIVKKALLNGKHVLCEKILSNHKEEVIELIDLSNTMNLILDIDYTFLHNNIVKEVNNYISQKAIGDVISISFKRMGYGPIRKDVDVLGDLIAHDLSMLLFWGFNLKWVQAVKCSVNNNEKADIATVIALSEGNILITFNVSWFHPLKQRTVEIVGKNGMIIFDDVAIHEKLKIINIKDNYHEMVNDFGSFQYSIKSGDITIPNIKYHEPLSEQLDYFIQVIKNGADNFYYRKQNITIAISNLLSAIEASSEQNGIRVNFQK